MPAGFYALNDYGTFLIDDTNPTLALRQKTVVNSTNQDVPPIDFANPEFPSIAFRSTQLCFLNGQSQNGSSRRFGLRMAFGVPNDTITAYIYDRPVDNGAGGFQVRDSLGRLTFDALGKYGRVGGVQNGNGTFVGVSGRIYAATILSSIYLDEIIMHPFSGSSWRRRNIYVTGARASGSDIIVENLLLSQIDYVSSVTPGVQQSRGSASVLITDVTGY